MVGVGGWLVGRRFGGSFWPYPWYCPTPVEREWGMFVADKCTAVMGWFDCLVGVLSEL